MLHMTRVAFGCATLADLVRICDARAVDGRIAMTTRYLPKRHVEIAGRGSLYWIIKHQLVARAPVLGFEDTAEGRTNIICASRPIRVAPTPRRAHQGWRYLEPGEAPLDIEDVIAGGDELPADLASGLSELGIL
jgi:hypothetical protein